MQDKAADIVFVMGPNQPVPPVRGGAAETLVTYLINENEQQGKFRFTIVSVYDENAVIESAKYTNTKFEFIKINSAIRKFSIFCSKAIWKIFHVEVRILEELFSRKAARDIKKLNKVSGKKCNLVIVENNVFLISGLYKRRFPIVLHLHNDFFESDAEFGQRILDKCSMVISVSEFIAGKLDGLRGAEKKSRVILNCTETDRFNPDTNVGFRRIIREKYGIGTEDILLIFSGRLHPTKGVKELLQAFVQIPDKNIYLILVGGDWYSSNKMNPYIDEVRKLAEKKKENIIWTGYVDYKDMPGYYAAADIAVFPSVWEEPSALVILEAEAAGLPIITTRQGGIPENCCEDAVRFIEVDDNEKMIRALKDAILSLSGNPQLRWDMGRAGRKFAEKRDTKTYYEEFGKLFLEVE